MKYRHGVMSVVAAAGATPWRIQSRQTSLTDGEAFTVGTMFGVIEIPIK